MTTPLNMMRRHRSIIGQYGILNECLHLVSKSQMKTVRKLTIETQLIRLKKLLLEASSPGRTKCPSCGEDVLEELLSQMRTVCGEGCDEAAVEHYLERIGGILSSSDNIDVAIGGGRHEKVAGSDFSSRCA